MRAFICPFWFRRPMVWALRKDEEQTEKGPVKRHAALLNWVLTQCHWVWNETLKILIIDWNLIKVPKAIKLPKRDDYFRFETKERHWFDSNHHWRPKPTHVTNSKRCKWNLVAMIPHLYMCMQESLRAWDETWWRTREPFSSCSFLSI